MKLLVTKTLMTCYKCLCWRIEQIPRCSDAELEKVKDLYPGAQYLLAGDDDVKLFQAMKAGSFLAAWKLAKKGEVIPAKIWLNINVNFHTYAVNCPNCSKDDNWKAGKSGWTQACREIIYGKLGAKGVLRDMSRGEIINHLFSLSNSYNRKVIEWIMEDWLEIRLSYTEFVPYLFKTLADNNDLRRRIDNLERKINEIIEYAPDGIEAERAKEDFESYVKIYPRIS